MKIRVLVMFLLMACALALSACGGGEASTTATATFPVTIKDDKGVEVTITSAPARIVALAPSFVEVLFAIGAGSSVVAADENSDYPTEAASIPKISGFQPSLEGIAGYNPDLVLMLFDPGGL
ncbi:MAG TPA: ABC transporter substrate-binding protein, partial [Dehalococcoidia bacterium]|nr:ABC transporter substrate-binding protein [Dehalococcoidia bacterium]